jgi:hypothetical protein
VDWKEKYLEMCEQNMTLREKLEMLEAELSRWRVQARRGGGGGGGGHSDGGQQPSSDSPEQSKGGAPGDEAEGRPGPDPPA